MIKYTRNINYHIRNNADDCRNDKHRTTSIIVGRILNKINLERHIINIRCEDGIKTH